MKKSFALLALVPFVLFSCQKEVAQNDIDTVVPTLDNGIPTVITCDINQEPTTTRTQYAGNQTFGWTNGDQVKMVVKNGDGWYYFPFTTSDESGKASAVFELLDSYNPPASPNSGEWENTGYIIYPGSIFIPEGETQASGWNSGDYPVVDLPSSYPYSATAPLNSASGVTVPLIGRKVGSTYRFSTAVGIIKVTISNISSSINTVKLISTDKCIAGKFAISESDEIYAGSDIKVAQIENDSDYNSAGTKEVSLSVSSLVQGGTYSFYFPVPVGEYPENSLRVEFNGEDGDAFCTNVRRIQKPLTITRNEILELPALTCPSFEFVQSDNTGTHDATTPRVSFNCLAHQIFYGVSDQQSMYSVSSYGIFTNKKGYSQYVDRASLNMSEKASGKYFFHYILANDETGSIGSLSSEHIIGYGAIPFYYLTSADATAIVGKYSRTVAEGDVYSGTAPETSQFTFAVCPDATKGNIIMTGFDSWAEFTTPIPGVYNPATNAAYVTFYNANLQVGFAEGKYLFNGSQPNYNNLVIVFNNDEKTQLYMGAGNFGVANTNVYPPTWEYVYNGNQTRIYTQVAE